MSIPLPPPLPLNTTITKNIPSQNKPTKYIGLQNQGSTCYLNSLIQSLFMTPEFRQNIFSWKYNKLFHGPEKDCIPFQIKKLFYRLQNPIRQIEKTSDLTKSFQWNNNEIYIQQDIEELCRVLFEAIEISMENNFIEKIYKGNLNSIIKCLECGNLSIRNESFLDLSLPILNEKSLEMAILNYIKPEKLENNNKYFCEKCNKKVNAEKYLKFEKLPKILFIQLGRFYYDFNTQNRKKIHNKIPFPLILNFNKYLNSYENIIYNENESENDNFCINECLNKNYLNEGENVYELFSIVIQSGNANGGHYYAYIKSFEDEKWYNFNDSDVNEIETKKIIETFGENNSNFNSVCAYCLMYRKMIKNEKFSVENMILDEDFLNEIKDENERIKKIEEEEKIKLNSIEISIFDEKNVFFKLKIDKNKSFNELKKLIIEKFNLNNNEKFKLREFNSYIKKPLDYIEITNENNSIENCLISQYKHYFIQKEKNGNFPIYDSTLIELFL